MNSHTSAAVKGQSIGLVTAIVDGESQLSKEVPFNPHVYNLPLRGCSILKLGWQFDSLEDLFECPVWNLILLHSYVSTYAMINVVFVKVGCHYC